MEDRRKEKIKERMRKGIYKKCRKQRKKIRIMYIKKRKIEEMEGGREGKVGEMRKGKVSRVWGEERGIYRG